MGGREGERGKEEIQDTMCTQALPVSRQDIEAGQLVATPQSSYPQIALHHNSPSRNKHHPALFFIFNNCRSSNLQRSLTRHHVSRRRFQEVGDLHECYSRYAPALRGRACKAAIIAENSRERLHESEQYSKNSGRRGCEKLRRRHLDCVRLTILHDKRRNTQLCRCVLCIKKNVCKCTLDAALLCGDDPYMQ